MIALSFASVALTTAGGAAQPASPQRERVLRSWDESVKIAGRDVPRRVEIVFDYAAGVARRVTRDATGRILAIRRLVGNPPQPSPEEIDEAMGLVRVDPELRGLIEGSGAVLEGGFLLSEGRGQRCGPRTRCLQIQLLTASRLGLLRRVVVDLVEPAIRYRSYDPPDQRQGKQ